MTEDWYSDLLNLQGTYPEGDDTTYIHVPLSSLKALITEQRERAREEAVAVAREVFWKYKEANSTEGMEAAHKILSSLIATAPTKE